MRVRVPDRLRPSVGRGEIVRSFGGVSTKEAYRLGWLERAEIEKLFERAEVELGISNSPSQPPTAISERELINLSHRFLRMIEATAPQVPLQEDAQRDLQEAVVDEVMCLGHPDAIEDATLQCTAKNFAEAIRFDIPQGPDRVRFLDAIREAWIEHLNRQLARLSGATVATLNPAFAGVDAENGGGAIGPTLGEAIELYIQAPERGGNSGSTRKMDRSRLGVLRDIVGASRPVTSITVADMRDYAELLRKLPAHYTKRFKGLSPQQAIAAAAKANSPTLSATSIKRDLQATKSFFGWLEKQEIVARNPARHLEGPRTPKKSDRRPFEPSELRALLQATPRNGAKAWAFWSTRIGMLQGFRFTEPLGLQVKDVIRRGNVWVFRLRPNEFRSLKNTDTEREVPIHPELIRLGILSLIEGKEPDDLLLPGTPRGEGKAFNAAQKQMSRIVRRQVSADRKLTYHSLRHSFRDAMRDGGIPPGVEERLGGWKVGANSVMNSYGRGHRLEVLAEWIAKVVYPGVEID